MSVVMLTGISTDPEPQNCGWNWFFSTVFI